MKGQLEGGCLCGAVRYTLREGVRLNPYACHCTDCQSRTGTAFSEHMLFALADIEITGELDIGEYVQPSGTQSRIFGCVRCKSRIYATNSSNEGMASLRCGTTDNSASFVPAAHIWIKSKQPWIVIPAEAKTMDEQPRSQQDWVQFLGLT